MSEDVCQICGKPATTADGICGFLLCDDSACLEAAWDIAFPDAEDDA